MGNSYISILDLDWENGEREAELTWKMVSSRADWENGERAAEHPPSEPRLSNRLKTDRVDCAPS